MSNASPRLYRPVASYISFHARRRPHHTAVLRNGTPVSYAALDRDLRAMTLALARFGLPPGAVAAVTHADLYIHLLLAFGFASLGVVTGSFRADEGPECHALLANADLVVAPHVIAQPACKRLFTVTPDWVNAVLASPVLVPVPLAPASGTDPLVIFRSSGTTGQPKRMVLTQEMFATRMRTQRRRPRNLGLGRNARFLAIMHFSAGSMFMAASNCLKLGATFMFHNQLGAAEILAEYQPTHVTLLPFQLRILLSRLPEAAGPPVPGLTVQTVGAKLPEDLRRRALRVLASRTVENYGANETGSLGSVDEAGLITLVAGVVVEVVDPDGNQLPRGETGVVRARGPGMIHGYLDDPRATAAMFRDGWFYPGDYAVAIGPGQIRLVGRREDVLNLGGVKVACADVESKILAATRLRDTAVLQRNDGTAAQPIIVCAVIAPGADLNALVATLEPLLQFPFAVRVVGEIPRTTEGKIRRAALQQSLADSPAAATPKEPVFIL